MYIGRGVNSVSIVGRLSTLQSVHYQRKCDQKLFFTTGSAALWFKNVNHLKFYTML